MSDVKILFKSPTPFSFADSNTLLSLGLVSSSTQRVSQGSVISGMVGIQGNPGFQFTALPNASTQRQSLGLHSEIPLSLA